MSGPYATSDRPEVHDLVPPNALRLLDVGCNDGGFGMWLRAQDARRFVVGVEPNETQAAAAREHLNEVVVATYPDALSRIEGEFDCVSFNHVLEHIADPWTALRLTRDRLAASGAVIAIIPNIRYLTVMSDLVLRGRWEYRETGLLDRTHLRFFTRSSILDLFAGAGLEIDEIRRINRLASVRAPAVSRVIGLALGDIAYGGFAIRARAEPRHSRTHR